MILKIIMIMTRFIMIITMIMKNKAVMMTRITKKIRMIKKIIIIMIMIMKKIIMIMRLKKIITIMKIIIIIVIILRLKEEIEDKYDYDYSDDDYENNKNNKNNLIFFWRIKKQSHPLFLLVSFSSSERCGQYHCNFSFHSMLLLFLYCHLSDTFFLNILEVFLYFIHNSFLLSFLNIQLSILHIYRKSLFNLYKHSKHHH